MDKTISKTHSFGLSVGYEELDTKSIDFPVRRNLLGQKQLIDVLVDSFSIASVNVPANLRVNASKLLKIKFIGGIGSEGSSITSFHLTAYNNPYQLLLNHDAILDCDDLNVDSARIEFEVRLAVDGKIIARKYILNLHLIKAKPACEVSFIPKENFKYCHDNACVGHFEITNKCNYRYAELAAVALSLKYPQQYYEDIISFGLSSEIVEENPYFEASGLREQGESPLSILKIAYSSVREIEVKKLIAQNRVNIPVYIDLERLENPEEDVKYEKFFVVTKNILNDVSEPPKECVVPIYRDITRTSLFVSCNNSNVENNSKDKYGHYNWIKHQTGKKERFSGILQIFELKIGNEATNEGISPDSAVIIRNIKIIPIYKDNEIVANNDFLETQEIGDDLVKLKNEVDSFVVFKCKLNHKYINDIPKNHTIISLNIDFDYVVDEKGQYNQKQLEWTPFHAVAEVELEKDPGSEWLCVDYGTSATVAVFGDGTDHNFTLLQLNNRNKEIINEREPERFRSPRFEDGDYFLSSNIMLQSNIPSLDAETYDKSLIYLSPSEPRFHTKGYRLPYMKALAGYKSVPNSDNYSHFKYKVHESDKKVLTFEENPLEVDKIFRATYRSLFKDYITNCIPQGKEVNKMVLTVPNTYTPHHIEFIRNIVKAEIPSLRSDYVWFVSESDAIAYYYIRNWGRFNNTQREDEYVGQTEHVLVYDMGAGTLDVTYLTIEHLASGDKNVSMLSKMGLNKAGNYLDFVLASTLVELYPEKFPKAILSHTSDDTMQNLLGKLKFFIKNELKPQLFTQDTIIFSSWNGQTVMGVDFEDEELDLRLIRSSEKVQEFVTECTNHLFDRFMKINNLNMDESPIDTLIMTGRSIQFGNIKQQLLQRINTWNDDSHCKTLEIVGDQLKTIVSQGALYYAALYGKRTSSVTLNNRNIYAGYGILYVDRKNKWCYQPLLDSHTKSTRRTISKTGQVNGMQIFTYDTDRFSADNTVKDITLDMRNTIEAYLVQCYSTDPAKDYMDEERRNDYISIMVPFNPESVCNDTKNVHVRLEVDENNEMTFTAGYMTFETSAPVKIDVETNNTFTHSMWPYA